MTQGLFELIQTFRKNVLKSRKSIGQSSFTKRQHDKQQTPKDYSAVSP